MKTNPFSSQGPIVFDGAIGTELYARGFFINRPFEELNLNAPSDVQSVHESYIAAGAQVLTSNSFSITKQQLSKFDIADQQSSLLTAALNNAHQARLKMKVENTVSVGLSIGPTGQILEPLGPLAKTAVEAEFQEIAKIALASKVPFDFYNLETFSNIKELEHAIIGIRKIDVETPILASISISGSSNEEILTNLANLPKRFSVQALGLNCSQGPSQLLSAAEKLVSLTQTPLVIQPNAGLPQQINGRYFYMTSPDYLAKFAKRYAELGVFGVGGCCGTTPEHIRAIQQALKAAIARKKGSQINFEVGGSLNHKASALLPSLEERSRFSKLAQYLDSKTKIISIEISPPKGTDLNSLNTKLSLLKSSGIEFINVPDNPRANTKVSSLHLATLLQSRSDWGFCILPHLTTRDRNLIALQSDLLGLSANGVHQLLCITGDPPKLGNNKEATGVFDIDAIGLTYMASSLNRGLSPQGEEIGSSTKFVIGAAANPTALNLELEIQRWSYKVESGVDFAVTQPVFDTELYLRWIEKTSKNSRPHLIGLWPFVSLRNAEFMANEVPGIKVPLWALEEMAKAGEDKNEAVKRGVGIAQKIFKELEKECAGFVISAPLNRTEVALQVLGK